MIGRDHPWVQQHAEQKVRDRMDPSRIPFWVQSGRQPQAFIYDPAQQQVTGQPGDTRVWDTFPIHDPYWSVP